MSSFRHLARLVAMATAALFAATCGGGGSTSGGTGAGPNPVPTPTPAPTPTPVQTTCQQLGLGPGNGVGCPAESPHYLAQLEQAFDRLVAEQPQYFDFSSQSGGGQYRVRSTGGYIVGLIQMLERQGLCAGYDGEELQIKSSNAYNDQFDILTANGFMRRGTASYRTTCSPAAFPTPPPPFAPSNGCALPSSREVACGRDDERRYLNLVDEAITQLAQQRPQLFDFRDTQQGTSWFKVLDVDGYVNGLADILKSRGYCARWDGEELVVKNANTFSEHYDILTANFYIRRGEGTYRSSCFPAAF